MSTKRLSFKYYPRMDKQNKQGLYPIYARILADKKIELSTGMYIELKQWNNKVQRLKKSLNADTINSFLDSFHSKVLESYSALFIEKRTISADVLKEKLFGKVVKQKMLLEVVAEHNTMFEKRIGIEYSYGSFKNYKTTKRYLTEFVSCQYQQKDIPIADTNTKFCEDYFQYLITEKPCNINGANKHIQRLKKIVNYAYKLGYIERNRLLSYSLRFTKFEQEKLTKDEIQQLSAYNFHNATLSRVKDIFLFQCFTGLAYADVSKLCYKHLAYDNENMLWLTMSRTKTKREFTVPIIPEAKAILNKYVVQDNEPSNLIFNVLSNQKMNAALKIIAETIGLKKNLSTHVARHSFATTITLQQGVPLETVSKLLGHSKITTTQIYATVTKTKIRNDLKHLTNNNK